MARTSIEVELLAITEKAQKSVDNFAKDATKSLSTISLGTSISAIKDGFDLVGKVASGVASTLSAAFSSAIDEAAAAEQSLTALSNALRLQNDFSETAVEDLSNFATELQNVSIYSDEAALNSLALAKTFRATNEEAKKVVKVAADLAAITGTDLETATQKVAQTLNGFVDKSLAKVIPGLKSLSKEALISGAAIDLIGGRVNGSAEALSNTFSGAVAKTKNSFSDFQETIGGFVTSNPVIIAGIKAISDTFKELNETFKQNGTAISSIVTDGFIFIIESIPAFLTAIREIDRIVSGLIVTFYTFGRSIGAVAAALVELSRGNFAGIKEINQLVTEENAAAFEKNRDRLKNFYDPVIASAEKLAFKIKNISKDVKNIPVVQGPSLTGKTARLSESDQSKAVEEQRKIIEKASKEPIKALLDLGITGKIDTQAGIAIGAGLINGITKGAKGAQELVAQGIGAIADTILPGIGGVVSEIVGVLAQGPDKVREMIKSFVDALPEVISNIIQAVPVLIEELSKAIPVIIQKLVDQLPVITEALVKAMPSVGVALALQMPKIALSFITSLVRNIPQMVQGFAEEFLKLPARFIEELLKSIPGVGGLFGGGGGGGGGILSNIPVIGGFLEDLNPFALGGEVPDSPKYANDKFPARLSAGENVIDRSLNKKLESYLDGNNGTPTQIVIKIGEKELANVMLDLSRKGFRTGFQRA